MVEGGVYENPCPYEGKPFTSDDIGDFFGYVYLITNKTTGKKYIAENTLYRNEKPKGGKRKVTNESDWKKYYGSSPELKADVSKFGKGNFSREIISLHRTLGKTNYEETRQLFLNNVLTDFLTTEYCLL